MQKNEKITRPKLDYILYHVSEKELQNPRMDYVPSTHEYGRGFYAFLNKNDAVLFGRQTGRNVLNQYKFNIKNLSNRCFEELNEYVLVNMFLIADDDYINELRNGSHEYLIDLREEDCISGPMLSKSLEALKQKWNDCEMPIQQCADLAKEVPMQNIMVLRTPIAFGRLMFEKSEII